MTKDQFIELVNSGGGIGIAKVRDKSWQGDGYFIVSAIGEKHFLGIYKDTKLEFCREINSSDNEERWVKYTEEEYYGW